MTQALTTCQPAETDEEQAIALPNYEGLTAKQSAFVRCYVEHGDGNATSAALAAGYASSSAHAVGYRLLRHDAVLRAIQAETTAAFAPVAPIALKRMVHLAQHARSEFVQQQASADLLDRAGHKPVEKGMLAIAGRVTIDIAME